MRTDKLTGQFCHKRDRWGNLILWVEYEIESSVYPYKPTLWWRKAEFYDLPQLKIN